MSATPQYYYESTQFTWQNTLQCYSDRFNGSSKQTMRLFQHFLVYWKLIACYRLLFSLWSAVYCLVLNQRQPLYSVSQCLPLVSEIKQRHCVVLTPGETNYKYITAFSIKQHCVSISLVQLPCRAKTYVRRGGRGARATPNILEKKYFLGKCRGHKKFGHFRENITFGKFGNFVNFWFIYFRAKMSHSPCKADSLCVYVCDYSLICIPLALALHADFFLSHK